MDFLSNAVFGMTVVILLFMLVNCEPQRRDARDAGSETSANIETERRELADEIQMEVNQLERMVTDYETRMEDENLPQETKDSFRKMANDLENAKDKLESELNDVKNATAENWEQRKTEARQAISEVSSEVEQITAGIEKGAKEGLNEAEEGLKETEKNLDKTF